MNTGVHASDRCVQCDVKPRRQHPTSDNESVSMAQSSCTKQGLSAYILFLNWKVTR